MSKLSTSASICRFGGILSTVILMIGMIVIGAIVADMYGIVQKTDKQTIQTQQQVNKTVIQILQTQESNNQRGNESLNFFGTLLKTMLTIEKNNQENITDHRIIANQTRDTEQAKLDAIIELLTNKTR